MVDELVNNNNAGGKGCRTATSQSQRLISLFTSVSYTQDKWVLHAQKLQQRSLS